MLSCVLEVNHILNIKLFYFRLANLIELVCNIKFIFGIICLLLYVPCVFN